MGDDPANPDDQVVDLPDDPDTNDETAADDGPKVPDADRLPEDDQ